MATQPQVRFSGNPPPAGAVFLGPHSVFVDWKPFGMVGRDIFPLLGRAGVLDIPEYGIAVKGIPVAPFPLQAVGTDADIYRPGDTAHVPVYLPGRKGKIVTMEVYVQGVKEQSFPLTLDQNGMAHYIVPGLKAGQYRVVVKDVPRAEVTFMVAKFQLLPLTARMVAHEVDGREITVQIVVNTYGTPFADGVDFRVEAQLDNTMVDFRTVSTQASCLQATLTMPQTDGQVTILVRDMINPDRVAQVVVPGSRKAKERRGTPINSLGPLWEASTVSLTGGRKQRGLSIRHLSMVVATTPVEPVSIISADGLAGFRLTTDVETINFQVYNPESGRFEVHSYNDRSKGDIVAFDFSGIWCRPYISAWVIPPKGGDPMPWSGFSTIIRSSNMDLTITVPESCRPGEEVTIGLSTGTATGTVAAWVEVREARITASQTLETAAANSLMTGIIDTPQDTPGFVKTDVATLVPPPASPNFGVLGGGPRMRDGVLMSLNVPGPDVTADDFETLRRMMDEGISTETREFRRSPEPPAPITSAPPVAKSTETLSRGPVAKGQPTSRSPVAKDPAWESASAPSVVTKQVDFVPTREEEDLGTVFAGLVHIEKGRGAFPLLLPDVITALEVSAFAVAGIDYGEVRARVEVTQPLFAKLQLPLELAEGNRAVAKAYIHSASGEVAIDVKVDGVPQNFAIGSAIFRPGTVVATVPCEISFDVRAGSEVIVTLSNTAGEVDQVSGTVGTMGKYKYTVKTPMVLLPGQEVRLDGDIVGIRVLPGIAQTIAEMSSTVRRLQGHECFGQTGQVITANMVMAIQGDPEAIRAFVAAVKRAESMYVPGQGAKYYPSDPYVTSATWKTPGVPADYTKFYWVHMGIMALLDLAPLLFGGGLPNGELADAVTKAVEIGQSCARIYGIDTGWKGNRPGLSTREYFKVLPHVGAAELVPNVRIALLQPMPTVPGEAREIRAYAAAIYARAGMWADAIPLANGILAELDKAGKPASYSELTAVLLMMRELSALQNGVILVDGTFRGSAGQFVDREAISSVQCYDGAAVVSLETLRHEDWAAWDVTIPLRVEFTDRAGDPVTSVMRGDTLRVKVTFANGYKPGQLIALKVPDALSFMMWGADVKEAEVDPQGKDFVVFDVVATKSTAISIEDPFEVGGQRFYVLARDMNDERQFGAVALEVWVN